MMTIACYTNSHKACPAILNIYILVSLISKGLFIGIYIHKGYISMRGKVE
jgi:hypothetical protein